MGPEGRSRRPGQGKSRTAELVGLLKAGVKARYPNTGRAALTAYLARGQAGLTPVAAWPAVSLA